MSEPLWKLKQRMCEIGKRIWQRGYCAGNEGNHSIRIGEDRVLCTPTGVSKGFLSPEMVTTVDMDGEQVDTNNRWKRTSEVKVHLAIYKQRDDVGAVIHSHPPHATAFAVSNIPVPEGIHPEAEVFLGRIPMAPYATPSKEDLPNSILPLIGAETNTVLMGNHGSVSFSTDLIDAYYKLEILDAYCRLLLLSKQLGRTNQLDPEQMTELLEVKKKFGMTDPRLECAPAGCVGQKNEPFLENFDCRPVTVRCDTDGGEVARGPASSSGNGRGPDGDERFEQMVQTITDQIMASAK